MPVRGRGYTCETFDQSGCDVGQVLVIFGGSSGLTSRDQAWNQGSDGIKGTREQMDHFGRSLAAGDFDDDGYDDLAIGVPFEDVGTCTRTIISDFGPCDAGAVQILFGGSSGLTSRDQLWDQDEGSRGQARMDQRGQAQSGGGSRGGITWTGTICRIPIRPLREVREVREVWAGEVWGRGLGTGIQWASRAGGLERGLGEVWGQASNGHPEH